MSNLKSIAHSYALTEEDHSRLIILLHKSIICGENYFVETKELSTYKDEINKHLLKINIVDDKLKKKNEVFKKSLELYYELIQFSIKGMSEFGSANKTLKNIHISSITEIKTLQRETEKISIGQSDYVPKNIDFILIKLNIILSEFDFTLNCNSDYISGLVEIYALLEFWSDRKKETALKNEYDVILKLMIQKCTFLLGKSLIQRKDFDKSTYYYSYKKQSRQTFNGDDIFKTENSTKTDFFKMFVEQANKNALNYNPSLIEKHFEEEQAKYNEYVRKNQYIPYSTVHFLCKYYRHRCNKISNIQDSDSILQETIKKIDNLTSYIVRKFGSQPSLKFNYVANKSLLFLIQNTKLKIINERIIFICEKAEIDSKSKMTHLIKYYSLMQEVYNGIVKSYSDDKSNLKEFLHKKLYLKANLSLGSILVSELEQTSPEPDNHNLDLIEKLSHLAIECTQTLPDYITNLRWAVDNYHMPLYLPYEQCIIRPSETENDIETHFKPFLCSSYLAPINYIKEKEERVQLQLSIQELLTRLLIAIKLANKNSMDKMKESNDNSLKKTESQIQERFTSEYKNAIKKAKNQIYKQISDSNIRSIQHLGIFAAVIALVVATWQNVHLVSNINNFSFGITFIGTILMVFITALTIITSDNSDEEEVNKNNKKKIYFLLTITLALGLLASIFSFRTTPLTKDNNTKQMTNRDTLQPRQNQP